MLCLNMNTMDIFTSKSHPFQLVKCVNRNLDGQCLEGVKYEKKVFPIYGIYVEGVFPVFEGIKITLQADVDTLYAQLGNTDYGFYHGTMREATRLLKQRLRASPELHCLFSDLQLNDIDREREKIIGKIWHHYEELSPEGYPIMQLVDERLHSLCKHTGGSYTWNPKHYRL